MFDLNMLDSNISLFLLAAEFKDDPLELKPSDKLIIEALKNSEAAQQRKLTLKLSQKKPRPPQMKF